MQINVIAPILQSEFTRSNSMKYYNILISMYFLFIFCSSSIGISTSVAFRDINQIIYDRRLY